MFVIEEDNLAQIEQTDANNAMRRPLEISTVEAWQ
jgi:hypothetical protein